MKRNQILAVCASVAIGTTTLLSGVSAFAAEDAVTDVVDMVEDAVEDAVEDILEDGEGTPFRDLLEADLEEDLALLRQSYPQYQDQMELTKQGAVGNVTVSLGDTGKAFLGLLAPVDLSWLDSVSLDLSATLENYVEAADMTVGLNGTPITKVFYQLDFDSWDILMALPELANGYLKGNYFELLEQMADSEDVEITGDPEALLAGVSSSVKSSMELPDIDVLESVLRRYAEIVYDAFEEGGVSDYTVEMADLSRQTQAVYGVLTAESAQNMVSELLTTAKTDAELEALLAPYMPAEGEGSYASFQEGIDEMLSELAESQPDEEQLDVEVALLKDENDALVGGLVDLSLDGNEIPVCSAYELTENEKTEKYAYFDLSFTGEIAPIEVYENLTAAEDVQNGYAVVVYGDTEVLNVDISDLKVAEDGSAVDGVFRLSVPAPDEEAAAEDEVAATLAALSGFDIGFEIHAAGTHSDMLLSLNTSGVPLVTLSFTADEGVGPEILDAETLADTYEITDEEALGEYLGNLDITGVLTNLVSAGMPEDFINSLLGAVEDEAA